MQEIQDTYLAQDSFSSFVSSPFSKEDYLQSRAAINSQQEQNNRECLELIEQAYLDGKIGKETKEHLEFYYEDQMEAYRQLFRLVVNSFGGYEKFSNFTFSVIDPITEETIIEKTDDIKYITPNTRIVITQTDSKNNPLYITLPGIKNINRAIEKVKCGGLYDLAYQKDAFGSAYTPSENRPEKPHERLRDVLRFSLSVKRYEDVLFWEQIFNNLPNASMQSLKKDKFCNNCLDNTERFSNKDFRNLVLYLSIPNTNKPGGHFTVEVQIKITSLEKGDKQTHPIYREIRKLKDEISFCKDEVEIQRKQLLIKKLNHQIAVINLNAINNYNSKDVIEKVMRMERQFKILGIQQDPDGTYPECCDFLQKNFLVYPNTKINLQHPFPRATEEQTEIFNRYKKILAQKYMRDINNDIITQHIQNTR